MQNTEQAEVSQKPSNWQMDKQNMIYLYNEILGKEWDTDAW